MINKIDNDLVRIAKLSKLEQQILTALPYFDTTGAGIGLSELSKKTSLPRTSLPKPINKLISRGFVVTRKVGNRTRYFENVTGALQMVPSISKLKTVHTLQGFKNVITIFERLVALSPHQRFSGIQPDKSLQNAFKKLPLNYLLKFNKTIKSKELIVEGIVHEKSISTVAKHFGSKNSRKVFDSFTGRLEDYTRIPDEFADVGAEIYLFKNSANLINWDTETAVVITDQSMVQLLKAMFDCVKTVGTKYNQSEKMKNYVAASVPSKAILPNQSLRPVKHE